MLRVSIMVCVFLSRSSGVRTLRQPRGYRMRCQQRRPSSSSCQMAFVLAAGRWQQGQSKDHKQTNDMQPPGQPELAQNPRGRKIKAEQLNGQRPYGWHLALLGGRHSPTLRGMVKQWEVRTQRTKECMLGEAGARAPKRRQLLQALFCRQPTQNLRTMPGIQ